MADVKKPELNVFKDKSAVSVAVATLILLLFSFLAFRLFSSSPEDNLNGDGAEDIVVEESTDEEANEEQTEDQNSEENENEEEVASSSNQEGSQEEGTVASSQDEQEEYGVGGAEPEVGSTAVVVTWVANNYNQGDLKGEKYTVQQGDTLWEIAEGFTGNGANWQQLAQANNVQYNSMGYPLIYAGQTLTIPSFN